LKAITVRHLANKRVVVTGATGNIGWGVAKAALDEGADVTAIVRSSSAAETVAASLGHSKNLSFEVGDLGKPSEAQALRDRIAARGAIDHVVAAIGPWWQKGPIIDQPFSEYAAVREVLLDPHVYAATAFLPLLNDRDGSSYTIITGAAAHIELPGTGLLVVAVSGVVALSRMLRSETVGNKVRVNEILIKTRIEKEPRDGVIHAPIFGEKVAGLMNTTVKGKVLGYQGAKLEVQN
jgi:NAD(P)-dependent dehydrogenase (short-subunit alcohol dehydrogenase family)